MVHPHELHYQVGHGLNRVLAALDESSPSLEGVLQQVDFNRTVAGQPSRIRSGAKRFVEGEGFAYLGRSYRLTLTAEGAGVRLDRGRFHAGDGWRLPDD